MTNPVFERENNAENVTRRIVPVYRLSAGLNGKTMANAVRQGLDACMDFLPEPVPFYIREKYSLASATFAYESIHFPGNENDLLLARRKLIFEELYVLSCALGKMRSGIKLLPGRKLNIADKTEFFSALPFEMTNAQKRAVDDVFVDMTSGAKPMSRLVQGDVGSGKTAVAAAAALFCFKNGCQTALMAPTEILAPASSAE